MNKKNVPESVLAKFKKLQEDQEVSRKKLEEEKEGKKNEFIRNKKSTWKSRYIRHDFRKDFALPIPDENGEVFFSLTQDEVDELNTSLSEARAPHRYRKFKTYLSNQQKILLATYGKDYPLVNEYLEYDARCNPKNLYYLNNRVNKCAKGEVSRFGRSERGNASDKIQIGLPNLPSRKRKSKK